MILPVRWQGRLFSVHLPPAEQVAFADLHSLILNRLCPNRRRSPLVDVPLIYFYGCALDCSAGSQRIQRLNESQEPRSWEELARLKHLGGYIEFQPRCRGGADTGLTDPARNDKACFQEQSSSVVSLHEYRNTSQGEALESLVSTALPLPPQSTPFFAVDRCEKNYEDVSIFLADKLRNSNTSRLLASSEPRVPVPSSASSPPEGLEPPDSHCSNEGTNTSWGNIEDLLTSRMSNLSINDQRAEYFVRKCLSPFPSASATADCAGPLCQGGAADACSYFSICAEKSSELATTSLKS